MKKIIFFYVILLVAVYSILFLTKCVKDDEQGENTNIYLEQRASIKLPIFYNSTFTTDNFLQQGQQGYQNIQRVWNKSYVDSITFVRSQNALVNISGVVCGVYRVSVYDADTIVHIGEYLAKNISDSYTLYPQGQNLLTAYNYCYVVRADSAEQYFDLSCGRIKLRHFYNIECNYSDIFVSVNSQLCNSPYFRFNHTF